MELVGLVQQALQSVAETAATYRLGQAVLRQMDRALWVLEKSARWAVPPPVDCQDDRPAQELVRPLPWLPFLLLLVALRVTRESISIFNLLIGKPPLHSADVVSFLQCKRRYLRALKYQGCRTMRARRADAAHVSWLSRFISLFEFTMCFRRRAKPEDTAGNTDSEEILVVRRKQSKKEPDDEKDGSMDRLLERMMVDLNTDSDDDSSYTLTNATGAKDCSGSDPDSDNESTLTGGDAPHTPVDSVPSSVTSTPDTLSKTETANDISPPKGGPAPENASTPRKGETADSPKGEGKSTPKKEESSPKKEETSPSKEKLFAEKGGSPPKKEESSPDKAPEFEEKTKNESPVRNAGPSCSDTERRILSAGGSGEPQSSSPRNDAEHFLAHERGPQRKSPKRAHQRLANGKAILSAPSGKKGMSERRVSRIPVIRVTLAESEDSEPEDEENSRIPHKNGH